MPSLCALLGNVEITVCPGEVTIMQELRAVSSLRMHSPECTMQQTQGVQLLSEQHDLRADRWVH